MSNKKTKDINSLKELVAKIKEANQADGAKNPLNVYLRDSTSTPNDPRVKSSAYVITLKKGNSSVTQVDEKGKTVSSGDYPLSSDLKTSIKTMGKAGLIQALQKTDTDLTIYSYSKSTKGYDVAGNKTTADKSPDLINETVKLVNNDSKKSNLAHPNKEGYTKLTDDDSDSSSSSMDTDSNQKSKTPVEKTSLKKLQPTTLVDLKADENSSKPNLDNIISNLNEVEGERLKGTIYLQRNRTLTSVKQTYKCRTSIDYKDGDIVVFKIKPTSLNKSLHIYTYDEKDKLFHHKKRVAYNKKTHACIMDALTNSKVKVDDDIKAIVAKYITLAKNTDYSCQVITRPRKNIKLAAQINKTAKPNINKAGKHDINKNNDPLLQFFEHQLTNIIKANYTKKGHTNVFVKCIKSTNYDGSNLPQLFAEKNNNKLDYKVTYNHNKTGEKVNNELALSFENNQFKCYADDFETLKERIQFGLDALLEKHKTDGSLFDVRLTSFVDYSQTTKGKDLKAELKEFTENYIANNKEINACISIKP